jgi:signal transduction histidine kinase
MTEVAQKITEKMSIIARDKNIKLDFLPTKSIIIRGTQGGLERVLVNLLQNAIEHTPKGGSIMVEISTKDSQAILKVSDTGSGIEEKDLPHLFERFYKGDGTSGSGLGLSIVKELVDQHGGSIVIASIKGQGTEVTIKVPVIV